MIRFITLLVLALAIIAGCLDTYGADDTTPGKIKILTGVVEVVVPTGGLPVRFLALTAPTVAPSSGYPRSWIQLQGSPVTALYDGKAVTVSGRWAVGDVIDVIDIKMLDPGVGFDAVVKEEAAAAGCRVVEAIWDFADVVGKEAPAIAAGAVVVLADRAEPLAKAAADKAESAADGKYAQKWAALAELAREAADALHSARQQAVAERASAAAAK